jgi:formate-dependent nitrite reductase cytochrome c552 subunit
MTTNELQKIHRCIQDDTTMKSLHFLSRAKVGGVGSNTGNWQKSGMKICSKCGLVMFFKKNVKYVVFPNTEVMKIEN